MAIYYYSENSKKDFIRKYTSLRANSSFIFFHREIIRKSESVSHTFIVELYCTKVDLLNFRKLFQTMIILVVMMDCGFVTSHITKEEEIQMLVPPVRPRIIATSEDLRRYLQQLNQYYMILSRPR